LAFSERSNERIFDVHGRAGPLDAGNPKNGIAAPLMVRDRDGSTIGRPQNINVPAKFEQLRSGLVAAA
jgi:hypothetical protein